MILGAPKKSLWYDKSVPSLRGLGRTHAQYQSCCKNPLMRAREVLVGWTMCPLPRTHAQDHFWWKWV